MPAPAAEPWARVRHVVVPAGARSERAPRSVLPWLSAAALCLCAGAALLGRGEQAAGGAGLAVAGAEGGAAAARGARELAVHPAIAAAEAAGLVQAVGGASKARMAYSALAHVKGAPPAAGGAGGPAGKAVAGKVVAGKSAAEIRAAAAAAVRTHILAEAPANETDAAADAPADAPAGGSFAKDPSTLADAPESQIDAAAKAFAVTPMLMSNGPDVNTDKVLVKLYMESQCPACRRFSTTYLKDIVEAPGMSDILDLEFVPFGNGRVIDPSADPNSAGFVVNHTSLLLPLLQEMAEPWHPKPAFQIVCQHGIDECMGNALEACVQDVQPDMRISFPVLDCIENRGCPEDTKPPDCVAPPQQVAQGCVVEKGQGKINVPQLLQCMQGTRSQELMIMNDVATLNANIQWAPWITVDGEDLIQDPNNPNATVSFREMFLLGKKICDTYASKTGCVQGGAGLLHARDAVSSTASPRRASH
jgi:hypothetical protein